MNLLMEMALDMSTRENPSVFTRFVKNKVSWMSKRQLIVVLSSLLTKYVAITKAIKNCFVIKIM